MRSLALAYRKRELRAERRLAEVLAGGWGRGPQEAAWDAALPAWRELLAVIAGGPAALADSVSSERGAALSLEFQRLPRYMRRPWYRLLMQTLHRSHDERGLAPEFGRWGGYPLR